MKKLAKTKFFVIAIFALATLLASCDNTAGGSKNPTTDNGQGNNPKSVLDTPQNALKNIPLVSELINEALGKTPSNPSIRAASAFDDVKDGLENSMLGLGRGMVNTEPMMAILKLDFSKMNFKFGDIYKIPSDFDFSQETRNFFHNHFGEVGDAQLSDDFRNFFKNAFFQIVKDSPTIVYCYFKANGADSDAGTLVKLSENITGILDVEFFNIPKSNHYMYERTIESNGKKIVDGYYSESGKSSYSKIIIDNINSDFASYSNSGFPDSHLGNRFSFRNKSVSGNSSPSSTDYATADGKILRVHGSYDDRYFLKYLTPIKPGLQLDGDIWKWGDTPATEIKFTTRDGRKIYYVEESDLAGNFSVPESTKNIITTLDTKFAEMQTEANKPNFFLTEIPNEADWKKRLDDWIAICESAE